MTTSINITGSGFYPAGNVNFAVTTSTNISTSFSCHADTYGNVTYSIAIASIIGISNASYIALYAMDTTRGVNSNTFTISVTPAIVLQPPNSSNTIFVLDEDTGGGALTTWNNVAAFARWFVYNKMTYTSDSACDAWAKANNIPLSPGAYNGQDTYNSLFGTTSGGMFDSLIGV